jgi:hypothetical protein
MGAGIAYWGTGVSSDVVSKTIAPGATATNQYLTEAAAVPGCTGGKKLHYNTGRDFGVLDIHSDSVTIR